MKPLVIQTLTGIEPKVVTMMSVAISAVDLGKYPIWSTFPKGSYALRIRQKLQESLSLRRRALLVFPLGGLLTVLYQEIKYQGKPQNITYFLNLVQY